MSHPERAITDGHAKPSGEQAGQPDADLVARASSPAGSRTVPVRGIKKPEITRVGTGGGTPPEPAAGTAALQRHPAFNAPVLTRRQRVFSLSASTDVPRSRERERMSAGQVRGVGEKQIPAAKAGVRCRSPKQSERVNVADCDADVRRRMRTEPQREFLEFHRDNVFLKEKLARE